MKTLKEFKGVKEISKPEQIKIQGGRMQCGDGVHYCPPGYCCSYGTCWPDNTSGHLCQVQP